MSRIYPDFAYGTGPRAGCFWDTFAADAPGAFPALDGDARADLCIIGAGFTGLNAALAAAGSGARVIVLEAQFPGWGASGRNGGFCCLGGGKTSFAALSRAYGEDAARAYYKAEFSAIDHVREVLSRHRIDADTHSDGETELAHTPRHMKAMEAQAARFEDLHGLAPRIIPRHELAQVGMRGPFHGAVTIPVGFALNPRKYVDGLIAAARAAGVAIHGESAVTSLTREGGIWRLDTAKGRVRADKVIVATNGYSSEHIPEWLAARFLPTQSTVLVTRPITPEEQHSQGWTSRQMSYDSRNLVHYFRLMPDGRMLFGMRGGVFSSAAAEKRARAALRRHFREMFPAWANVDIEHEWSGMVCLSPKRVPFAGPVPGQPGLYAGFAYHGNGVSMGSHVGDLVGRLATGAPLELVPEVLRADPGQFPFGRFRRVIVPALYTALRIADL
ncbi:MAG: FAD-dependent oxidoreductase [Rhodobacteraceae bacterium]|nr:MAG: FAD-dependent oxidoreductase [Paracoccaceae bacterium]